MTHNSVSPYTVYSATFQLDQPYIQQVDVSFPTQSSLVVAMRVRERGSVIMPAGGGGDVWLYGSGETVHWFADGYRLNNSPYEVSIDAFNIDASVDYTILVTLQTSVHPGLQQTLQQLMSRR